MSNEHWAMVVTFWKKYIFSGRGVNIASDMKLSQFDLISTPTGNETTTRSKGKTYNDNVCGRNWIYEFISMSTYVFRFLFNPSCEFPLAKTYGRLCYTGRVIHFSSVAQNERWMTKKVIFFLKVYGPCILLVVISWVSFWLNREATSDRISLGMFWRQKYIFLFCLLFYGSMRRVS